MARPRREVPHPLVELTRVRLLDFVRSPGTVFWVFGFPVLLAVALGIAFRNQPPVSSRVAIVGEGRASVAGRLAEADGIEIAELTEDEASTALRKGAVDILIRVEIGPGDDRRMTYRFDPTRPEGRYARLAVDAALQAAFGRVAVIAVQDEKVTEVGGRYIDFLIPGLIGLNIMSSCVWGIGYNVVDSRRRKLLKRFAATPMVRSHFLASFILSRLAFLVAEVAALLVFGLLIFDVQINGGLLAVAAFSVAGAFAFSGLALLIAARPENTEVASGWMNFAMLPARLGCRQFRHRPRHIPLAVIEKKDAMANDDDTRDLEGLRLTAHEIIFRAETPAGKWFDVLLIVSIVLSVIVVMLDSVAAIRAEHGALLYGLEWVFTGLFTLEYIVRLVCAASRLRYATSFFGVVDLLAILPTFVSLVLPGSQYLAVIRVLRILRIFRVLKLVQYLSEMALLRQSLARSRRKIVVFLFVVATLVTIFGSLMYLIEGPENGFTSIPRSIYWAVVTLTTVGYGDISPGTGFGQFLSAVVMILGYSIIVVPTGFVTVELSRAMTRQRSNTVCPSCDVAGHDDDARHCKHCGSLL